MKNLLQFSLLLIVFCVSCKKDDLRTGDLKVYVQYDGQYVEGAKVYLDPNPFPPSVEMITDQLGVVLFKDLDTGNYFLYAYIEQVGSGLIPIRINSNELTIETVKVYKGFNVGLRPAINLLLPEQPAEFMEGDTITFSAKVSDDKTASQDIAIEWKSNLDGILNTDPPGIDSIATFSTHSLSFGEHEITLTAKDKEGYSSVFTFQLSTQAPDAITLFPPVKNAGKVELQWTVYPGSDFLKYEVYQSSCSGQNEKLIATITDIGNTTFIDEAPPLNFGTCYFVRVTNTFIHSRNSNFEYVENPAGPIFTYQPYDMLKHPTENFIYLLNQGEHKLIKFDYLKLEPVKEIDLPGFIGFCDIGDNGFGLEIYAPSEEGSIYVYDANDLNLVTTINTGLNTTGVVINGSGHVIATVKPPSQGDRPIRIYRRSDGAYIDGGGNFEGAKLRMIPGKNEFISISSSSTPTYFQYFKLSDTGTIELFHSDHRHPLYYNIFRISPGGSYLICSNQGAVYSADSSMTYKGMLERLNFAYSDFAFNDDGTIIYGSTPSEKTIQIAQYPSLKLSGEKQTKGYPFAILRDNDKIIGLSKIYFDGPPWCGVEVINL